MPALQISKNHKVSAKEVTFSTMASSLKEKEGGKKTFVFIVTF